MMLNSKFAGKRLIPEFIIDVASGICSEWRTALFGLFLFKLNSCQCRSRKSTHLDSIETATWIVRAPVLANIFNETRSDGLAEEMFSCTRTHVLYGTICMQAVIVLFGLHLSVSMLCSRSVLLDVGECFFEIAVVLPLRALEPLGGIIYCCLSLDAFCLVHILQPHLQVKMFHLNSGSFL